MEEGIESFVKELALTCEAIVQKWGNPIVQECGTIHYTKGPESERYILMPSTSVVPHQMVVINRFGCRWKVIGGLDKARQAEGIIQRLALYLAADDFTKKVKGSIGTLKRVQKALSI